MDRGSGRTASAWTIDPITLEVVRNRLDVIAQEMESALIRSAFSVVIKEGADCSCALFTPQGETMAQSVALPQHLGVLAATVKSVLRAYPAAQMAEGDVYIMNDPYDGGTHIPDINILMPVFWQDRLVALASCMAHQQDMGGMAIGSLPPDATEIFQEGLVLPPVKLMEKGEFNRQVLSIILKNVRIPTHTLADFNAQIAAVRTGAERFQSLCDEYGADEVASIVAELMDRAEALTRARIAEIPDGVYTFWDWLDNDGVVHDKRVKIQATMTVKGSAIHVDFTGSDPQVLGAANASYSHAACVTYYCVRCVTDPTLPNNAGCFRPVSVTLPEGTVVNPRHPAAVNARTMTVCRMTDVIFGCLAQAAPEKVRASSSSMQGVSFSGRRGADSRAYVYLELFCGGMGARPMQDGVDYIETDITNMMNTPTEAIEMEYPLRVHSMRLKTDSGGAGRQRGGLGMEKVIEVIEGTSEVTHRGDRHFTQPWGLRGGRPGMSWSSIVHRRDGTLHKVPARQRFKMEQGERIECVTAGGGGYGDPLERAPSLVREDVRDRKVSVDGALRDYGVVLSTDLEVDETATEGCRARLREARGALRWVFDRGDDKVTGGRN